MMVCTNGMKGKHRLYCKNKVKTKIRAGLLTFREIRMKIAAITVFRSKPGAPEVLKYYLIPQGFPFLSIYSN